MKIASLFFLLTMGCSFVSCSSTTDPKDDGSFTVRDFLPTGIVWTYDYIEYDETGAQTLTYSKKYEVFKIPDYKSFDTYSYSDLSMPNDTNAFYYLGDTSLYFVHRPSGVKDYAYLYPMAIDDKRYTPMGSSDTEVFALRSNSVSVTVGAGTFDCLKYEEVRYSHTSPSPVDSQSVTYIYISPKNGRIKFETYAFNNNVRWKRSIRELKTIERK